MGTPTTNYSLDKPTIGGDNDTWGDESPGTGLNENMNIIDAQMKANADDILLQVPLTGERAMTGELTLDGPAPTADNHATTKLYVDTADALALPKDGSAPVTGSLSVEGSITSTDAAPKLVMSNPASPIIVNGNPAKILWSLAGVTANLQLADINETAVHNTMVAHYHESGTDNIAFNINDIGNVNPQVARINYTTDTDLPSDTSIVTRARGDARYLQNSPITWGNFLGADGSLVGGSGMTAVRNSVAQYTITLDTPATTANYAVFVQPATDGAAISHAMVSEVGKTVSSFKVYFYNNANNRVDPQQFYVRIMD